VRSGRRDGGGSSGLSSMRFGVAAEAAQGQVCQTANDKAEGRLSCRATRPR